MKHRAFLGAGVLLAFCAAAAAPPGEMKDEVKVEGSSTGVLRNQFGTYGDPRREYLYSEPGGLRFWFPARAGGVAQAGFYSYFTLSGDCEASFTYEILKAQAPQGGYGSGVGLAFDAGEEVGRGSIQRVEKEKGESGYVLQTVLGTGAKAKEEYRFVSSAARRGRIGLRRAGKELIFLTSDDPADPLEEADRLPFTDRTIRAVRIFADTGGSLTALDVRAKAVRMQAEEVTAGVPQKEEAGTNGWWIAGAVGGAGLLFWGWRIWRRRIEDEEEAPSRRVGRSRRT
jgi:hypothetical protein